MWFGVCKTSTHTHTSRSRPARDRDGERVCPRPSCCRHKRRQGAGKPQVCQTTSREDRAAEPRVFVYVCGAFLLCIMLHYKKHIYIHIYRRLGTRETHSSEFAYGAYIIVHLCIHSRVCVFIRTHTACIPCQTIQNAMMANRRLSMRELSRISLRGGIAKSDLPFQALGGETGALELLVPSVIR